MVAKWEPRIGVTVAHWRIRRMKTGWDTGTPEARRIWVNSELTKKPVACLECVVVYEMIHLIERGHNKRSRGILGPRPGVVACAPQRAPSRSWHLRGPIEGSQGALGRGSYPYPRDTTPAGPDVERTAVV